MVQWELIDAAGSYNDGVVGVHDIQADLFGLDVKLDVLEELVVGEIVAAEKAVQWDLERFF